MSKWIRVKDQLPKISNHPNDDIYQYFHVLAFCPERPGVYFVASLMQMNEEENWTTEDLYWEVYAPGVDNYLIDVNFEDVTHWMELPEKPKESI